MGQCGKGVDKVMYETQRKIDQVCSEIHLNEAELHQSRMTMDEVLDIMLVEQSLDDSEVRMAPSSSSDYSFDMEEVKRWKELNNGLYAVKHHNVLQSSSRIFGNIILAVKKVIRKLTKFYIIPIVEGQNRFNGSVTASINALYNNEVSTKAFIEAFDTNVTKQIEASLLSKRVEDMSHQLSQLSQDFHEANHASAQREVWFQTLLHQSEERTEGILSSLRMEHELKLTELQDGLSQAELELDKSCKRELALLTRVEELEELNRVSAQQLEEVMTAVTHIQDKWNTQENQMQALMELVEKQGVQYIDEKILELSTEFHRELEDRSVQHRIELVDVSEQCHRELEDKSVQHRIELAEVSEHCHRELAEVSAQHSADLGYFSIKYDENLDYIGYQINKLSGKAPAPFAPSNHVASADEVSQSNAVDLDYFKFENQFRGSRKSIKESQQFYLQYFEGKKAVLDLGCGRGEFLELLKDNQIVGKGVDLYPDFVGYCNYKALDVQLGDAIEYLEQLEEESIDGLFCSQMVEHIETAQILRLCTAAYQKLQSGCYVVLETPNPTCLGIYKNWFYVDPTHQKPIHPKFLEFALREAGFKHIELIYTESSKEQYRLPLLNGSHIENLAQFNDGINLLTDIIFGSQDYALIGRK